MTDDPPLQRAAFTQSDLWVTRYDNTELYAAGNFPVRLLGEVMPRVRAVQEQILAPIPAELRPVFQRCLRLIIGLPDEPAPAPRRK